MRENSWQPIETAPNGQTRCLLWCIDVGRNSVTGNVEPRGTVFGRLVDGQPYGDGMNGDWTFTHWMPLPEPPHAQ